MQWQPGRDILGAEYPASDELARKIFAGIGRHIAVRREESRLGAEYDFIPREAVGNQLFQGGANGPFTSLEAVIDGRVDDVEAAFDSRDDRTAVRIVGGFVRLAEVSADTDRRQHEPARNFPEMPGGRFPPEPRRIAQSSLRSGGTRHELGFRCRGRRHANEPRLQNLNRREKGEV